MFLIRTGNEYIYHIALWKIKRNLNMIVALSDLILVYVYEKQCENYNKQEEGSEI